MIRTLLLVTLLAGSAPAAFAANWTVDPAKSKLGFSGSQTGQPFSGAFKRWTGTIDFDPAKPEAAHVLISVDMASATTGDPQKDEALPGSDWFDAGTFPKATFEATGFKPLGGDKFEADGTLTLRDAKKPVVLPFTLTITGDMAHAVGHADLLRGNFGVGQGAWASADYVAFEVGVDVDLVATWSK